MQEVKLFKRLKTVSLRLLLCKKNSVIFLITITNLPTNMTLKVCYNILKG